MIKRMSATSTMNTPTKSHPTAATTIQSPQKTPSTPQSSSTLLVELVHEALPYLQRNEYHPVIHPSLLRALAHFIRSHENSGNKNGAAVPASPDLRQSRRHSHHVGAGGGGGNYHPYAQQQQQPITASPMRQSRHVQQQQQQHAQPALTSPVRRPTGSRRHSMHGATTISTSSLPTAPPLSPQRKGVVPGQSQSIATPMVSTVPHTGGGRRHSMLGATATPMATSPKKSMSASTHHHNTKSNGQQGRRHSMAAPPSEFDRYPSPPKPQNRPPTPPKNKSATTTTTVARRTRGKPAVVPQNATHQHTSTSPLSPRRQSRRHSSHHTSTGVAATTKPSPLIHHHRREQQQQQPPPALPMYHQTKQRLPQSLSQSHHHSIVPNQSNCTDAINMVPTPRPRNENLTQVSPTNNDDYYDYDALVQLSLPQARELSSLEQEEELAIVEYNSSVTTTPKPPVAETTTTTTTTPNSPSRLPPITDNADRQAIQIKLDRAQDQLHTSQAAFEQLKHQREAAAQEALLSFSNHNDTVDDFQHAMAILDVEIRRQARQVAHFKAELERCTVEDKS